MFTFPLQLPSGKKVRLTEITNRELFDIIKFCVANDLEGLSEYLNSGIFKDFQELSIIEKLYILIYLRSFSLGFDIAVTSSLDKPVNYSLINIIENIEKLPDIYEETIDIGSIQVTVDIPTQLFFAAPYEVYFNIIKQIGLQDEIVHFSSINNHEKEKILEALPPTLFSKLNKYIEKLNNTLGNIQLIEGAETFEIKELRMNMISNQPLVFVQSIFSHDLTSFIQFMYHFVNKVGGTFKDFFDLTINDTRLMLDFYKEEIEKQNDELKNNQSRVK